jgi:imidazole glycerol phosphate synthase glutamine amidotransferase subunit
MKKVMIIPIGPSGNLLSVERAIQHLGYEVIYYKRNIDLNEIHSVILPGVGSFSASMDYLKEDFEFIKGIIYSKPTLGICLGMQILASLGFEGGMKNGLDVVKGEVVQMRVMGPIPHIGWTEVRQINNSRLLEGIKPNERFYFMHSYEFINFIDLVGLSTYLDHTFVSVIEKKDVFGVQFHPEKSGASGMKILRNFLSIGDKYE